MEWNKKKWSRMIEIALFMIGTEKRVLRAEQRSIS